MLKCVTIIKQLVMEQGEKPFGVTMNRLINHTLILPNAHGPLFATPRGNAQHRLATIEVGSA